VEKTTKAAYVVAKRFNHDFLVHSKVGLQLGAEVCLSEMFLAKWANQLVASLSEATLRMPSARRAS
ncbi:MAG: hypothetical protein NZM11_12645, partial [Anaerolineales bacterium]|nr:hypothetical protein [Anaerolineales bacterium]